MSEEKLKIIKDAIIKNNQNTSNVDVLARRLRGCSGGCGCGAGGISPELAATLSKNWRKYLAFVIFLIAILGAYHAYQNYLLKQAESAAVAFANIQDSFELLDNEDFNNDKVLANLALDFETAKQSKTYRDFSIIYAALFKLKNNQTDEALKILEDNFGLKKIVWAKTSKDKKIDEKIFVNELAELIYLRAKLNGANSSATIDSENELVRTRLKNLVENSELVKVPASSLNRLVN
ncbi:MAG: tetratricopeptide repeat protein [Deltaproteobacteria bacterium]|jgi:predicted negative regulator of RcsB-dependent stress response|nr:tetratricopeptide repeat protein [Deltaproteobacteria bacterium]